MMGFSLSEGSQRVSGNKKTVKLNTEGSYLNSFSLTISSEF